jgi:drug/metabolite transporter (DMT)-like permease
MLTFSQISLLILYVSFLSAGQIIFKIAAKSISGLSFAESLPRLLLIPTFYLACMLYFLATVLWVWILSRLPLNQAYPFVALALIFVPLMSWYFFAEVPTLLYWVGVGMVVIGLIVIAAASPTLT